MQAPTRPRPANSRNWLFGAILALAIGGTACIAVLLDRVPEPALAGAASGAGKASGPASGANKSAPVPHLKVITWVPTYEQALQLSDKQGKPIMLDFYTKWCGACKYLDKTTYHDQQVIDETQNWICVKVDAEERADLAGAYSVNAYPTLVFVSHDGHPIGGCVGAYEPAGFLTKMREAYSNWTPPARA